MRLAVNILHIPKLHKLIDEYDLLKLCLAEDSYGGWEVRSDKTQTREIERILKKHNIKYQIKYV